MKDKRLAFGRIVGKKVKMVQENVIAEVMCYDKCEHTFAVCAKEYKSYRNEDGIIWCAREDFVVM